MSNSEFSSFAPRHRLSKLISALGLASVVILTERSVGTFRSTPVGAEVKDPALGRRGMKASVNLQFPSFAPRHRLSKLISALGLASVATPMRDEHRLRRQRGMIALLATKGRFISPRGVCFSTINFSFPEECALAPLGLSPQPLGRWPKGKAKECET